MGGELLGDGAPGTVRRLLIDSRQLLFPSESLFFAMKGQRLDGHRFIGELYRRGVRHFVVERPPEPSAFPGAFFVRVPSSLEALQTLARHHRHRFGLPILGLTGSNGKTIVKEWLVQLLGPDTNLVYTPRSYNSRVGVPLSLWQIRPEHEFGIFEAGISQAGEMDLLARMMDCRYGIFTNLGSAHDAGFTDRRQKAREKARLFSRAEWVLYCADYPEVEEALQDCGAWHLLGWSRTGKPAPLQVEVRGGAVRVRGRLPLTRGGAAREVDLTCALPFKDDASVENALHCLCFLLFWGLNEGRIAARMQELEPVGMRMEVLEGVNDCLLLNDSYSADLHSLEIALRFFNQRAADRPRTLILSDILQSGMRPRELYAQVARLVGAAAPTTVIGIGEGVAGLGRELPADGPAFEHYGSTSRFLENLDPARFQGQAVLLKGARRFGFERIARRLARRRHRTSLEVNLDALVHNLRLYHRHLRPGTRLMVMVKAGAYGSGSVEVARQLEHQKVDYLGVAYADEGVELRKAGVHLPVMVLNPEEAAFDSMLQYDLEPEIYSPEMLEAFARAVRAGNRSAAIHLKLDTGMHRLGCSQEDLPRIGRLLADEPLLAVRSVLSHLAASENPEHDAFTRRQVERFLTMYEHLCRLLDYRPWRHILNSSGILRFPEFQFEMVRLGLGVYGVDSSGLLGDSLQPVLTLKATISQVRTVPAGETVGYGRAAKLDHPARIATVTIGYADGLLRKAGNGRFALLVHDRLAPIVGNVCMDMCMVDVTHIPEARPGDDVVVFG
ncbi:MAG: bifunctional UDP-N-acetylmuramoyl-tripeptide:D-alanyl-D-alanine ligase/alanine racemase, partial [Bacteroidetes bacterium]